MGTKARPGKFDCYAVAADNEPMFILLGRDEDGPELIESWCRKRLAKLLASELTREQLHQGVNKIADALATANAMRDYRLSTATPDYFNVAPLPHDGGVLPSIGEMHEAYKEGVCACPEHKAKFRYTRQPYERHGIYTKGVQAAEGWATGLTGYGEPGWKGTGPGRGAPPRQDRTDPEGGIPGRSLRRQCSRSVDCKFPLCDCEHPKADVR